MRALGSKMFHDLKNSGGCLHELLNLVLQDATLELEMRGTCSAHRVERNAVRAAF